MKYNLHINQKQAIELGIKNFNQAHIFDLISMCSVWAKPITVDDKVYYWVARQVIIKELPLMDIKADTAYRHLKALSELGLIEHIKSGVKDLVMLTDLGKTYHSDTMSEINPSKVGNKSGSNSEINPTYHTTKIHHTTKHHINSKSQNFVKPTHEEINQYLIEKNKVMDVEHFYDFYESKNWMVGKNKMKCWKSATNNWIRNNNKFTGANNGTHNNSNRKESYFESHERNIKELLNA